MMTDGEKFVWAATYAQRFMEEYNREQKYGKALAPHSTPAAIEWACMAVEKMREARKEVLEGWGNGDVLEMLDEILQESS